MFHHGKLLALKEDSPPVVLDPDTLETIDDYYTFGGKLTSLTFTAHPKIDSETGEMIAFGYEAQWRGQRPMWQCSRSTATASSPTKPGSRCPTPA